MLESAHKWVQIDNEIVVRALAYTFFLHPGLVRPSVGALGGRDKVQGVRQGAQGASPSAGSLEPPWSLPAAQNAERGPGRSHCVSRSVT